MTMMITCRSRARRKLTSPRHLSTSETSAVVILVMTIMIMKDDWWWLVQVWCKPDPSLSSALWPLLKRPTPSSRRCRSKSLKSLRIDHLVARMIWAAKWLVRKGAFGWLLRHARVTLTQNDNSYVFDWTNKHTKGVQWSRGWFLDPPFGHLAPDDQPCVFNSSKHKSQTAVEVKTQSSGLKNWLRAQLFKCEW